MMKDGATSIIINYYQSKPPPVVGEQTTLLVANNNNNNNNNNMSSQRPPLQQQVEESSSTLLTRTSSSSSLSRRQQQRQRHYGDNDDNDNENHHHYYYCYILGTCICGYFSDMNTVSIIFTFGFPTLWLCALSSYYNNNNCRSKNNNKVLFSLLFNFVLPCLCRACGSADYFHIGKLTLIQAYFLTLVLLLSIMSLVFASMYIQITLWQMEQQQQQQQAEGGSDSDYSTTTKSISIILMKVSNLAYPTLLTGIFQLLFQYSPIGTGGSPSMSLSLVQNLQFINGLVSCIGEIGLIFWIGLIASIVTKCLTTFKSKSNNKYWIGLLVVLYVIFDIWGGWKLAIDEGLGMNNPINNWPLAKNAPSLQISCICPEQLVMNATSTTTTTTTTSNNNSSSNIEISSIISIINQRLQEGDDLIILAEATLKGRLNPNEINWPITTKMTNNNTGNSNLVKNNPGAVVVASYLEYEEERNNSNNNNESCTTNSSTSSSDDDQKKKLWYNSVEFLQAGKSILRYDKNRAVPFIAPGFIPGNDIPKPVDIVFTPLQQKQQSSRRQNVTLKVATAICFDFNFPHLFSRYASKADIVVGPSNYWASLGKNLWSDNRYRAIENGFTLLKCSRDGITGAVDPMGQILWQRPTIPGMIVVAQIPIRLKSTTTTTIYANYYGSYFGWVCVILSLFWIILFFFFLLKQRKSNNNNDDDYYYGTSSIENRSNNNINNRVQEEKDDDDETNNDNDGIGRYQVISNNSQFIETDESNLEVPLIASNKSHD